MTTSRTTAGPLVRDPRPSMLIYATVVMVIGDGVVLVATGTPPRYTLTWLLAVAGLLVAGAVVIRTAERRGTGALLVAAAGAAAVWDAAAEADGGPFPFLSGLLYWLYAGLLVWSVLRWPDTRLGAVGRVLLGVVVVLAPAMTLLWQLTWTPEGAGTDDWWWVTAVRAPEFSTAVYDWQQVLFGTVSLCLAVLLVARTLRAAPDRRRVLWPVTAAATVIAAVVVATAFGVGQALDLDLVANIALVALPVGVLVAEHRARRPGSASPSASSVQAGSSP